MLTKRKIKSYAKLMRLDKPIGIYLLLWPTLWALWISADGRPSLCIVFVFIAGVVLMRSAGCVINDIADKDFDGSVRRTAQRPLVTKQVNTTEALILFFGLCFIAFLLVLFLNIFSIALATVALLLASIYPFAKRVTHLPQFILGAAFSWSIPMAFAAQQNLIPGIAWLLFAIALVWTVIYDTLYAMVDREDDIKVGIKSTAILFGQYDKLIIGFFQITMVGLLFWLSITLHFTIWFYVCLSVVLAFMLYQQFLIKNGVPKFCFDAFLNNNWIGLVIFVGIVLEYWT